MVTYPPGEDAYPKSPEAKTLMGHIDKHYESLGKELTAEQNIIFEKYNECYAELSGIIEREIFTYAFRLGAKMALEVMIN